MLLDLSLAENSLWILVLLLIFFTGVILAAMKWIEYSSLKESSFRKIDKMTGTMFEKYLELLFREQGYKVSSTALSGDYGADLILQKGKMRTAVQAKRYGKSVGIRAVQEVIGAKHHYRCQKAMVVTNSYFTPAAWVLAKSSGVRLVDRKRLIEMISGI